MNHSLGIIQLKVHGLGERKPAVVVEDNLIVHGAVTYVLHLKALEYLGHTQAEILPVFVGTAGPSHLRSGHVAREGHPLGLGRIGNVLSPEAGLVTNNVFLAQVGNGIHRRIIIVHLLERHEHLLRKVVRLVVLMVVEVAPAVGGKHHADAAPDAPCRGSVAAVRHGDGVVKGTSVQNLVPSDAGLAVGLEEVTYPLDEEGLELLDVLEPEHLHQVLAVLALAVHVFGRLVTADMVDGRGEEFEQLAEYIFQELESVSGGSIEVLPDAPAGLHLVVAVGEAAQLGIGGDGSRAVTRDLDLGNHSHAPAAGIFHHLADIVFGVESAVRLSVAYPAVERSLLAPGADLGEAGILVDLDTPALVFRKVPVEHVLLVHGHEVDELHHFLFGEEVTAAVEQEAAVCKLRLVHYGAAGRGPLDLLCELVSVDFCRKQLEQRLKAVEGTVDLCRLNEHAVWGHFQGIGLLCVAGSLAEDDCGALAVKLEARGGLDLGAEIVRYLGESGVLNLEIGVLLKYESTVCGNQALGGRHDVVYRRIGNRRDDCKQAGDQ